MAVARASVVVAVAVVIVVAVLLLLSRLRLRCLRGVRGSSAVMTRTMTTTTIGATTAR